VAEVTLVERIERLLKNGHALEVLVDMNQNKHLDRGVDRIIEIITEYL